MCPISAYAWTHFTVMFVECGFLRRLDFCEIHICLFSKLSTYLSACLSAYLPNLLSTYLPTYQIISLPACLPVYPHILLFIHPSIHLHTHTHTQTTTTTTTTILMITITITKTTDQARTSRSQVGGGSKGRESRGGEGEDMKTRYQVISPRAPLSA